ncbi:hypothetical protein [Capybara microvirus Cap3_SP_446]|nr:hypothetical protein [Capybara microvirus Cap3_SP_446]
MEKQVKRFVFDTIYARPHVMKLVEASSVFEDNFDKSKTDLSKYIPQKDQAMNVALSGSSSVVDGTYYDFKDGKDTGEKVPFTRRRGLDIAELSTAIDIEAAKVKGSIKNASENLKKQEQIKQELSGSVKE